VIQTNIPHYPQPLLTTITHPSTPRRPRSSQNIYTQTYALHTLPAHTAPYISSKTRICTLYLQLPNRPVSYPVSITPVDSPRRYSQVMWSHPPFFSMYRLHPGHERVVVAISCRVTMSVCPRAFPRKPMVDSRTALVYSVSYLFGEMVS
jgi:hypothetical protein